MSINRVSMKRKQSGKGVSMIFGHTTWIIHTLCNNVNPLKVLASFMGKLDTNDNATTI
jgi:hypothetical protein